MEMNNNTKINIEMQLKFASNWDKRSLFYLAKMYVEDLRIGEDYSKLKKSIHISLLDFNLTKMGLVEAVNEVKFMSLSKKMRLIFEAHLKEKRDRRAREDYVRLEGEQEAVERIILNMIKKGMPDEDICALAECNQELVDEVRKSVDM